MMTRGNALSTTAAAGALAVLSALVGCANPNAIGVQDTGSITGRVIDANTQAPVAGAYVSVGNVVVQTDNQGVFNFGPPSGATTTAVPVGQQTVTVHANAYNRASLTVNIVKNQTSNAGLVQLTPIFP